MRDQPTSNREAELTAPTRIGSGDLLGHWLASFKQIEAAYQKLRDAFGATPESEIVKAMYDTHHEYTKLVAEKVGDKDGWLEWFLWENNAGAKGLEAKAPCWKKARKIKTVKDLEAIIVA